MISDSRTGLGGFTGIDKVLICEPFSSRTDPIDWHGSCRERTAWFVISFIYMGIKIIDVTFSTENDSLIAVGNDSD